MITIRNLLALLSVSLAGCSMLLPVDSSIQAPKPLPLAPRPADAASAVSIINPPQADTPDAQVTQFFKAPTTPPDMRRAKAPPPPLLATESNDPTVSAVTLDNLPLPQFANTVYATILKRNVSLDAALQNRTDLVSLHTGKPQTAAQLAAAAQTVLRAYGVTVNEFNGVVRIVPSGSMGGASPEILRGRAQPDVPASLRPLYYYVELENTSQASVASWVRTLYQGRVTVTDDVARNALMINGQSDSVLAAVEAVRLLDQPALRGRYSARFTPVFWSASDMALRLSDVLTAQGYMASQNPVSPSPILILPIGPINSVVVFSVSEEALNHTLRWARELDQNPPVRSGNRYITYYVRNTDAAALAKTLQDVLTGASSSTAAAGAPGGAPTVRAPGSSRVVVNAAANSIILQSAPSEYQQIYGLLQELDRPAKSALIMVTVAEVHLNDSEQMGFNWLLSQFTGHGFKINGSIGPAPPNTLNYSGGGIGINIATVAGDPRALLTALSTSSRVRVLSNPSVVALNGQTATLQSGQDVPVVTSQISNSNTGTSTGQGIMQSVQYRNVGIILKVKPIIHSAGRIDLEISQEVSSVAGDPGVGGSPIVGTRKVDTQLSVVDGNSMLIGGLISETRDGGNSGVPLLKDIPIAGALFRTAGHDNVDRTELVILITPHIIEDDFDSRSVTEAFRNQFSWGKEIPLETKNPPVNAWPNLDAGMRKPAVENQPVPYVLPPPPVAPTPRVPQVASPTATPVTEPVTLGVGGGQSSLQAPTAPTQPAPTEGVSQNGDPAQATNSIPKGGKLVTDEKLRQELLDAIRNGK